MVKLELEPRQSNPRIWAPNHNILYKTLSHVKTASGCQVLLRDLGEGLSLNFKDTSFNSTGLEVTHKDSSQESKGEVRCVMFSDTKCDVCPSSNSSSILPHQGGVWQFSSILTHNYQELASDSTCLRAQPHKTAPLQKPATNGVSRLSNFCLGDHKLGGSQARLLRFGNSLGAGETATRLRRKLIFSFRTCLGIGRCWRTTLWWWQVWCLHHCLWDPECHTHWSGTNGFISGY